MSLKNMVHAFLRWRRYRNLRDRLVKDYKKAVRLQTDSPAPFPEEEDKLFLLLETNL